MTEHKKISLWGSTGSIGTQTIDVMNCFPGRFDVVALTVHQNAQLALEQVEKVHPRYLAITGDVNRDEWQDRFRNKDVQLFWGKEGLLDLAGLGEEDLVVNALVGSVGLEATMKAVQAGTAIALANKEVLVMAGDLVTSEMRKRNLALIPIDSEHSALFQCMQGEKPDQVQTVHLTASGGPFLNRGKTDFKTITVEEALAHPNWNMGKKVTIDSATLANKGLEVIEARWLFNLEPDRINVVIHPQSIVHSMVEFVDGSIKAQMGVPDMRIPISYALTFPDRWPETYSLMDFKKHWQLEFFPPDLEKFRALYLAYEALRMGGTAPAVFNGADELAVQLFLEGRIGFHQIVEIIEEALRNHDIVKSPNLDDILQADRSVKERIQNKFDSNKK